MTYVMVKKTPFKFSEVNKKIMSALKEFKGNFIILKIAVVYEVVY